MLPGHSIEELIGAVHARSSTIRKSNSSSRPTPVKTRRPPNSRRRLYQTIERVTPQEFPGAVAVPLLSTGATDSASLRLHNVQAYGLEPFPLTEDDSSRMHGDDERIPVDSFHKGVAFLYHVVSDFASSK